MWKPNLSKRGKWLCQSSAVSDESWWTWELLSLPHCCPRCAVMTAAQLQGQAWLLLLTSRIFCRSLSEMVQPSKYLSPLLSSRGGLCLHFFGFEKNWCFKAEAEWKEPCFWAGHSLRIRLLVTGSRKIVRCWDYLEGLSHVTMWQLRVVDEDVRGWCLFSWDKSLFQQLYRILHPSLLWLCAAVLKITQNMFTFKKCVTTYEGQRPWFCWVPQATGTKGLTHRGLAVLAPLVLPQEAHSTRCHIYKPWMMRCMTWLQTRWFLVVQLLVVPECPGLCMVLSGYVFLWRRCV